MDLTSTTGLWSLMQLEGIGPSRAIALAGRFATTEQLLSATPEQRAAITAKAANIADVARHDPPVPDGAQLIGWFDDDYPALLRQQVPSPPALLWVVGTLPDVAGLAVVGTRKPTSYGIACARRSATAAGQAGMPVISGLAAGVDTAAHEAALDAGVPTVAVLGGGIDRPTPAANVALARRIVAEGGALVSEQPPGTPPSGPTLVARNRMQTGLSAGCVVAQCGIPSGTLHTARFSLVQGRTLIVPRPDGQHAAAPMSAGLLALTDPDGCDPKILSATGKLATTVRARRPVADVVVTDADTLTTAILHCAAGRPGSTHGET